MSILDKVREAVNKQMTEKAEEILAEVESAGYRYYPDSENVVPSFRIMDKGEGGQVSGSMRGAFLTRIRIGSDLREAYWAVYGNVEGSRGGRIYPHGKYLIFPGQGGYKSHGRGKNGMYVMPSVRAYKGHNFIKEVADRHR